MGTENVDTEVRATADETLHDLLDRTRRTAVPVRRTFLQSSVSAKTPGPLSAFVSSRRPLALDLWLLLHAAAAAHPWDVAQPAMSWARALALPETSSSETSISRNWRWLEEQQLVATERARRLLNVTLLIEDGSGRPFERATGKERGYFKVPYAYFTERWHTHLRLAGKAVLLISLAQAPTFTLPTEHAARWYGISADTLQRGFDELREAELIKIWSRTKKAPRARFGVTAENHYSLSGPFARVPLEVTSVKHSVP